MVDILLASLFDAIRANKDLKNGTTDLQDANDSSLRFIKALSCFFDERISSNIEDRRKLKSQEKASTKAIIALNSAPPPLEEVDLDDCDYVREWFAQYKHWYETKRKASVTNG